MMLPKTRSVIPLSSTAATTTRIVQGYKLIYSLLKNTNVKIAHQHDQLNARTSKRCCHASPSSSTSKKETPLLMKTTTTAPKAFVIGTVAGLLGSLAGMGGGFVMIPLMTSRRVLGLTQHQAHGTSLFAVAATGLAGACSYGDQVDWTSAAAIAGTGIFTARLGAKTTAIMTGRHLKQALGMLMLCMVPAIPLKKHIAQQAADIEATAAATALVFEKDVKLKQQPRDDESANNNLRMVAELTTMTNNSTTMVSTSTSTNASTSTSNTLFFDAMSISPKRILAPAAIGVVSGFLAGLFGVGGGTLVVPALTVLTDCTHYQALATSLAAMALPAIMGTRTHYHAGNVVMRVAPALATGAFVGAYCGGKIGLEIDETILQWGFSGLLLILGIRTIVKA